MNRREQIVENFEDAFMSLFMADIAEYEGKQYLEENEQLKNDETFVVPRSWIADASVPSEKRNAKSVCVVLGKKHTVYSAKYQLQL